jgi:hypothetical protein
VTRSRRFYSCKNKYYENRATRCDDRAIHADDIEEVVWAEICSLLSKPERLFELAEQFLGPRSSQLEVERDGIKETASCATSTVRSRTSSSRQRRQASNRWRLTPWSQT